MPGSIPTNNLTFATLQVAKATKEPNANRACSYVGTSASLLLCILAATYFPGRLPREYRRRAWVSRPCSGWERVGHQHYDHQKPARMRPLDPLSKSLWLFWVGRGALSPTRERSLYHSFTNRRFFEVCFARDPDAATCNKSPFVSSLRFSVFTRLSLPTARILCLHSHDYLAEAQEEGRDARRVQEFC
jgi:hypothetical protein